MTLAQAAAELRAASRAAQGLPLEATAEEVEAVVRLRDVATPAAA